MIIFDTLSGEKKPLLIPESGKLKLFVCGPTVYDLAHIGNGRTYAAFDSIIRYLRSQKIKVFYLQNITDIDDKIINRAKEEKKYPETIANFYTKAYKQDMKELRVDSVNKYAKATSYIRQIVKQIQALIDKGVAYKIESEGYYFDISKFPDYGKLSHRTLEQAEDSVSRIDDAINKRNKGDFCLWKFEKQGEPSWKTPLGSGRPGWHIEDTAITEYFFGPQYDIHGGGIDLKFPHHEAEIAQQESASGKKPMVKLWMHAGHLLVNGAKMAKSAGNFITIRDFLKTHSPTLFRYLVVSHHYRSPLDYSDKLAEQTKNSISNLRQFIGKLRLVRKKESGKLDIAALLKKSEAVFHAAMADDFNTPEALAALFGVVNAVNPEIWSLSQKEAEMVADWLLARLQTLGVELKFPHIPFKIRGLVKQRMLLRNNQQFVPADVLRKEVEELGYIVDDTPVGPLILKK
ncbi:MAG: cysteine--tRNA ligase [bacterium]|nr:cysteine--tRNA ligase [bacterium]